MRLVRCAAATPPPLLSSEVDAVGDAGSVRRIVATVGGSATVDWVAISNDGTGSSGFKVGTRANVSLGLPSTTGSLRADKIAAVVRAKLGELKTCYANDTSNASPPSAVIAYRFTIGGDGKVIRVESSGSALGAPLDACVKRVLRAAGFPAPPGGGTVTVSYPLVFDSTGTIAIPKEKAPVADVSPWTPFARDSAPASVAAGGAARATEAAIRGRLEAIDKCFTGPTPAGSLRVMLEIDLVGELGTIRTGGLGDASGEACVTKALAGIRVVTPSQEHVEVACDLSRGDAQPWRLATTAGYGVIEAERAKLRHGEHTLVAGASDPDPLPVNTYVVLVQPDTPGAMLQLALTWANDADAVLIALQDRKASPLFLGMGHTSVTHGGDAEDTEAVRPALRLDAKTVTGCVSRGVHRAKLADPREVGSLVQRLAEKCRALKCAPTLLVAIDRDAVARDLVEITGAARRAGFDRVLIGGSELGCQDTVRPQPAQEPVLDDDFE